MIKNVQSFALRTGRWSQLEPLPRPRHGLGVAAFGATLYTLDGAQGTGHLQSTNVVEEALDFK